ncbi:hypothetical protein TVAG_374740 [Trichomonas vaginalis G3]|uniref:Uncharacterized protein n=1 Tax=Trichomonas vaginalis (strain ATCC PRA-98 / G3) TaxID=412133 RepID=A2FCI7_TRIV3|nr:hypothetical protein TVAGG3_0151440 [Trichomonas vaginalis G3]EAX97393.1 hypothetical protein TVAG_374740 [Trichomonas vaginalis G3]KAI5547293.1 hypothetical protein TVAGG3_0151440 [Trichomonas vaginalis G3]|eukprot:XP_001310323.1 hypothetical protein [Trichomonas vaginalis G3]
MVRSSYEHDENDTVIQYIQSSFNNTKDMIKLYEYVEDNIYEHGNKTNGYISTSMLPFPMDIIDIQKWNELIDHCDENYIPMLKFCMNKGHIPYLYDYDNYGSEGYKYGQPKIVKGFVDITKDRYKNKMISDRILFERDFEPILDHYSNTKPYRIPSSFIHSLNKWSKIAINKEYNEQEYIDYFISNDFPLNRLRTCLVDLIKDLPKLYSRQIDEKENNERLIDYNYLLQKHCAKLIKMCEQYLEQQAKNLKESLTL